MLADEGSSEAAPRHFSPKHLVLRECVRSRTPDRPKRFPSLKTAVTGPRLKNPLKALKVLVGLRVPCWEVWVAVHSPLRQEDSVLRVRDGLESLDPAAAKQRKHVFTLHGRD